ncbi:DUF6268 family outer membrane beta-barrel protein [Pareuzebyella sediminis]|uniref:DUF6268 family outer membrane beta-barrel protein n=1 Tax=Pareuzebyella sediminis TaxID=2607998 RepID=UPI0011EF7FB2|nr:DUF6268 family outer membrane beta-barrel protein [Pareuzebyella sediminis]
MNHRTTARFDHLVIVLLWASLGFAQTPDVFRAEYMIMPKNKADAQLSRVKLVVNFPISVKDSNNIVIGGEYNRFAYDLKQDLSVNESGLKQFHVIDFNVAYVYRYDPYWRFIGVLTPRLASTLTNPIENGDFSVNATLGAFRENKTIKRPTRLVLGIAYNSTVALRVPLPIIYFEKRFHPNWSYVIGVPKTGMKYHLGERHMFQTEFIVDGYYVNLQNNIVLPNTISASSVSSSAALVTLGYQFKVFKDMFIYGYLGHTLFQDSVLRDEDRNDIFTLNKEPSFYIRSGFRIGL